MGREGRIDTAIQHKKFERGIRQQGPDDDCVSGAVKESAVRMGGRFHLL
jgi:hypothetical protein